MICVGGTFGGIMVSMLQLLDTESNDPGSNAGQAHCVLFLGKTLHPHSASSL